MYLLIENDSWEQATVIALQTIKSNAAPLWLPRNRIIIIIKIVKLFGIQFKKFV